MCKGYRKIMPKEIELEDGSKETVYTEEELNEYKEKSEKTDEQKERLSKLGEDLGLEEGQSVEDKIQELKENANPNFGKYRKKFNALEKIAKEKGVQIDDEGNVVSGDTKINAEEIKKIVKEQTLETLSSNKREDVLSQYEEEDKKLVEHYLDKLVVTGGSLEENIKVAEKLAFPDRDINDVKRINNSVSGGAPRRQDPNKKSFTDTEEGKKMLEQLIPKPKK